MGILERIEELLIRLVGQQENIADATEDMAYGDIEVPLFIDDSTPDTVTTLEKSGLDSEGNHYDPAIHSETKGKTKAGVFKKRRGVDKQVYLDALEAQRPKIDVETPESVIEAPVAPVAPEMPTIPENNLKRDCLQLINGLNQDFNVNKEFILDSHEGVDISSQTDDQLESLKLSLKTWKDWLNMCDDESVKIENLGSDAGLEGMRTIYSFYNKSTTPSTIDPKSLSVVYDSLCEYRKKWEAIQ